MVIYTSLTLRMFKMITRITLLFLVCLIGGQVNYANAANYEKEYTRLQEEKASSPVSARLLEHYNAAMELYNSEDVNKKAKGFMQQDSLLELAGFFDYQEALREYASETINDHGQVVALPDES